MSISNTANTNYASMDAKSIIATMTFSMNELHRMGTTMTFTDSEREVLQFAYDLLQATRNGMIDAQPKDDTVLAPAKNGTIVRGRSSLKFRN